MAKERKINIQTGDLLKKSLTKEPEKKDEQVMTTAEKKQAPDEKKQDPGDLSSEYDYDVYIVVRCATMSPVGEDMDIVCSKCPFIKIGCDEDGIITPNAEQLAQIEKIKAIFLPVKKV